MSKDDSPTRPRRLLVLGAGFVLIGAACPWLIRRAKAEDERIAALRQDLAADKERARGFYEQLRSGERLSESSRREIAAVSFKLRQDRAFRLQEIAKSSPNPDADLAPLLDPETADVAEAMRRAAVPVVPPPEKIKPDPVDDVPAPAETPEPPEKWQVVLVILLETFGFAEIRPMFEEALTQLTGFKDQQEKVVEAFRVGTPKQITDAIFGFIAWLLQKPVMEEFLLRLAARQIAAPVLRSFALRLVPWVGWAWLLVSFGLAVHRHWNELMK